MANINLRYNGDGQNYLVFLQFFLEEAAAKGLSEYFDVTIDIEPKKPVEKNFLHLDRELYQYQIRRQISIWTR